MPFRAFFPVILKANVRFQWLCNISLFLLKDIGYGYQLEVSHNKYQQLMFLS